MCNILNYNQINKQYSYIVNFNSVVVKVVFYENDIFSKYYKSLF